MNLSRAQLVAVVLAAIGTAIIGFFPLFGGPGYEAAVACGLLLPSIAAVASAIHVSRRAPLPIDGLAQGAVTGVLVGLAGLAVTFIHGLRVGLCDAGEGTEFFVLGPVAGCVFAGIWGAAGATAVSAAGLGVFSAIATAVLIPISGIVVSLYRFYTSPMVFAFDPFVGFFAGTLYDTVITGLHRLATYRIGTAMTVTALFAGFANLYRDAQGRIRVRLRGPALAALGFAALVGSLIHTAMGPELGHYQTTKSIREALGHAAISERCDVLYPSGVLKRDAHVLARECDAHVVQLEKYFQTHGPDKITAFVFASPDQKGYLMGAANTFIAKPWRKEIYIQGAGFPHRVLGHELAHVIAGSFARGPFLVAGPLGGLIPDPGRIEGFAVAAAPRDDDLTLQQWAKAMKDLNLLPPLDRVFKLSFLGEPSSRAYAVAGAFVEWLDEHYGADALKKWYSGARLADVSEGKGLSALERDWHTDLDKVKVSEQGMAVAKARFDRPAIFGRTCPHVVDRLRMEAGWAFGRLDTETARDKYQSILELEPDNLEARLGVAACALQDGQPKKAQELYGEVASDSRLPAATQKRAVEALADVDLMLGKGDAAKKRYDEVAGYVVDEDHLRSLDVKRYASVHAEAREAIADYLLGDMELGRDVASGAGELGQWVERDPKLGLADYLLSRSYLARGRWSKAVDHLDAARAKKLPIARVAREANKSRMVLACALGQVVAARQLWEQIKREKGLSVAARSGMESFLERCAPAESKNEKASR